MRSAEITLEWKESGALWRGKVRLWGGEWFWIHPPFRLELWAYPVEWGILNTLIDPPFDHPIWLLPAFLIGACIGSFLNVAIYRIPLGLSVNEPKRSFCPICKTPIPMSLNVPLVSWMWLRGKCASCKAPIAFRYFAVELLTALLFVAMWWLYPPQVAVFLWVYASLLVAITFIDVEHMIVPTPMTWAGSALGLVAAAVWPRLAGMAGDPEPTWKEGLVRSALGWAVCFGGLWLVVELGKMAFGKKVMTFQEPADWKLHEPTPSDCHRRHDLRTRHRP